MGALIFFCGNPERYACIQKVQDKLHTGFETRQPLTWRKRLGSVFPVGAIRSQRCDLLPYGKGPASSAAPFSVFASLLKQARAAGCAERQLRLPLCLLCRTSPILAWKRPAPAW